MTRSPSPLFSACVLLVTALAAGCQVQRPAPPAPKGTVTPVEHDTIQQAATLSGFSDQLVFSGHTSPIAVRFATNGKIFVAEENGRIYFYDSLTDTTATLFADLRDQVNSYWDRGMLGFTLDPNYATNGHVYVLYTHDTATNAENNQSAANRNATDNCPSPPGGTSQGCITYGVLARITDPGTGYPITARLDLITEWPQQFPSHAIGALNFGPDGFLYATGGDGASFNATDWGQFGIPVNPLGDPPGGVGGSMPSGTSRGGSSRSQSFRRSSGENVTLNGSVIRINPTTGAGATGNPNLSHADVDARRIIAIGLRNPYRFTFHPPPGDIWIGDVGANAWEEINRLPAPLTATPMKNFGWPCYEGNGRFAAWDNLNNSICEDLYAGGSSAHAAPYHAYAHGQPVYTGDACGTGSSAITGLAFYPQAGGNYPTQYRNALFFADLTRDCIFVVRPNATTGLPDMATRTNFVSGALNPSDLQIGPNNDLFYVDYGGSGGNGTPTAGTGGVRRIRYAAPTAIASANPTSGFTPLVVQFTGSMSTPGLTGDTLTYAWDLDGDGAYDDSTAINPSRTYNTSGDVVTRLKVTDQRGGFGESQAITINVGTTTEPPVPVIDTPSASLTWKVGDQISFSGHATDTEDGTIPASGLSWELVMMHCPGTCHEHLLQTFAEVASGTFPAPDHEYPSHLRLRLTATDSHGRIGTTIVELQAQTVSITLQAAPTTSPTLQLTFSQEQASTPFTRTAIVGSFMTLSAPQQTRGTTLYDFQSWAHGGTESQTVTIPATPTTYTATFVGTPVIWQSQDVGAVASAGSWTLNGETHTVAGNGADIWNAADEFRFVYQQLSGDGTITAKVNSFTNNAGNANGKAGVMIRESLNANSPHAMAAMPPQTTITLVKHVKRLSAGATSSAQTGPSPSFPAWVRVVRAGNTLRAYHSTNGTTFTELGTATTITTMTGPVFVGLAVSSHVDGVNATAVFDSVAVTTPAPPTGPTGLTASGGFNQAVLNWTDTSNNETGFKIERKLASDPDTSFAQVGTAAVDATTFTSTSLAAGSYSFRVRASGSPADSGYSNTASATVTDPPPPAAPSNLVAGDGVNQSVLTWTDTSSTETGFEIERKLQGEPDTSYAQVGTTSANVATFTNSSVPAGVYTYRVKATNGSGDSAPSNPDDATITDPQPPAAPTSLTATGGGAQAVLAWTDNANNETGFKIERKVAGDPDTSFAQVGTAGANATGFTNTSVPAGTYTYRVRATNAVADSEYSNTADATVTVPSGPTAPTNLSSTTANGNSVTMTWTDTSSNETGFRVERKVGPTGTYASLATKAANVVTHTDAGPLAANSYYYRVVATGSPDSAPSNEVVVVINNPVADSYVREGTNAGINYGTETFIKIKLNTTVSNNRRGYVRFSLANVGATVTSAKLRLYGVATTNTKNVGVHAVSNTTWGETTITFSNAPAMTTPAIQTRPITTTAAYVEWDVTAYVQSQRTANATTVSLGLLTTSSFPDTETNINSRENTANKPILIISSTP